VAVTPNDDSYPDQWHLHQPGGSDIEARKAWMIETGNEDITVAIIDTGVRYFHKDLGGSAASFGNPTAADGNMWINHTEKNGSPGVDDDGNGYVDDWIGWDFVDGGMLCWSGEDCDDPDNDPRDFNGHGTHGAGNVGAINNNGYAGCSPAGGWGNGTLEPAGNGVKIMACRVGWSAKFIFDEIGIVRMDLVAEALYYAADNGARIASCSFESSNSGGLGAAIDYFVANGGLIIKAANNDGTQTADYMCGRPDVISVAATGPDDCRPSWSNYGTWVDISAPGVGIYSLYHDHEDPQTDYVAAFDGTSVATPHTAGVAALIWSRHPQWTAAQVEQQLYDSADDIYTLPCNSLYTGQLGAGRINAFNAVNTGGIATGIEDDRAGLIDKDMRIFLDQNHPNPFNPSTKITFTLPRETHARLRIFDVDGGLVANLVDGMLPGGSNEVTWDGRDSKGNNVGSGVYFCRLVAGGQTKSRKMIVLK
jgi:subtilisin family serine protease